MGDVGAGSVAGAMVASDQAHADAHGGPRVWRDSPEAGNVNAWGKHIRLSLTWGEPRSCSVLLIGTAFALTIQLQYFCYMDFHGKVFAYEPR